MAFRFGDPGGRMYGTSSGTITTAMGAFWSTTAGSWSIVSGGGRTTGVCLSPGTLTQATKILDNQQIWGVAFAWKNITGFISYTICGFWDSATTQVDLRILSSGFFQITRNGTVLGTSTFSITNNVWYHLEFKVKIDPSVGTAELRVNGVSIIGPLTSQNTRATSNSSANTFYLANSNQNLTQNFDDIIVYDGQTTDAAGNADIHDFVGDCSLYWTLPTANGTTNNFTPSTGANYTCVNGATPSLSPNVQDATPGDIDLYTTANLPAGAATVKSMAVINYAAKSDSGARTFAAEIRSGGTNYQFTNAISPSTSPLYYFSVWGQNPNGPANWTPTTINSNQIGQTVVS